MYTLLIRIGIGSHDSKANEAFDSADACGA